jgi:hypothetical protein
MRKAFFFMALAFILVVGSHSFASDEQPELTFRQDGDDLVVVATLTVNNSPHVVLTESVIGQRADKVHLFCYVIQNRDLLVRSRKEIAVEWHLTGRTRADESYQVGTCTVTAGTGELRQAIAGLQDLMTMGEETNRVRRDPVDGQNGAPDLP